MIEEQTTIFDILYPKYKIQNKIRTIELFGGYGSQLMAIKRLTNNVEQLQYSEVSKYDYEILFRPKAIIPVEIKTEKDGK